MTSRFYIAGAAFIIGFAAAMLLYFGIWDNYFWFDEGIFVQLVKNIAERGIWGIATTPNAFFDASLITIGYPIIYPAVLAVKLFGSSIAVFHVVASFFTLGLVILFFLLSRMLFGNSAALWGTFALAAFTPLYGNGKSFAGEVPSLFFLFAALCLLAHLELSERPSFWRALFTGIAFGLAAAAKPTFLLVLPALFAALLWRFRSIALTREERRMVVYIAIGTFAALAWWLWTQFGGVPFGRIFAHYSNPYYVADFTPLVLTNLKRFFTESTPAHFAILFFAAIFFLARKIWNKESVRMAEVVAFIFALLTVVFYVRTEGWYRYFFPAHVTLMLFLAPAAREFIQVFVSREIWKKRLFVATMTAAIVVEIPPLIIEARRVHNNFPDIMGAELRALRDTPNVFFYNLPQVAARFERNDFYQYIRMSDNLIVGQENEKLLAEGVFPVIFVPSISEPEIKRIPTCFEFRRNIRKIYMYERNAMLPCDNPHAIK